MITKGIGEKAAKVQSLFVFSVLGSEFASTIARNVSVTDDRE